MNRGYTINRYTPLLLTLAVVALDRLTKNLVLATLSLHESIPFIGDLVRWTHVHNYGMLFSLDFSGGKPLGYLSLLPIVIILYLLVAGRSLTPFVRWVLAAVLGGAIGNTYDRIMYGYVIDFVDVDMPDWWMDRWPVFNVADAMVSVGITLLIIYMIFFDSQEQAKKNRPKPSDRWRPADQVDARGAPVIDEPASDQRKSENTSSQNADGVDAESRSR